MIYTVYSRGDEILELLPPRRTRSNKGDYGKLLLICGSAGMCGAALLAARAAYRTGAGLVRILTPSENLIPLQAAIPEAIVTVYDGSAPDRAITEDAVAWADAMVIGCGLGRSRASAKVLSAALRASDIPTVVDADGLNLIQDSPSLGKYLRGKIITPHLLEAERISGYLLEDMSADIPCYAQKISEDLGCICVLKDHRTAVADGTDGVYRNETGNSGMATAGSGDVLAGIIGGILAQNKSGSLSLTQAAELGVYLHGKAGDIAAERLGEYSLMASDIIDCLPYAITKKQ
jgi:NAD(P)H-hydrate epimerase